MDKTTLILGIDSLIGKALGKALEKSGSQIIGTSRRLPTDHLYLDVTWDLDLWPDLPQIDSLVVCASLNNLEQCEQNPTLSYSVNVEGLNKAIEKYSSSQTRVLFLSSSHVFSGSKPFCKEDDKLDPQNVLGRHKSLGEESVLLDGGLVIRVTKVVDPNNPRFIDWAQRFQIENNVEAFYNLFASLVPLDSLVDVMAIAVKESWNGIIHVSGPEETSYSDIAVMLAHGLGKSEEMVNPIRGKSKLINWGNRHRTLHTSKRVKSLQIDLPNTTNIIDRWCSNYLKRSRLSFDMNN